MKINNGNRLPNPAPAPARTDRTGKVKKAGKAYAGPATAPTAATGTDRVEVSDAGRAMQVATAALKQMPKIRADKVAELKARIKDGTYQVSGEDIAERMLADDLRG